MVKRRGLSSWRDNGCDVVSYGVKGRQVRFVPMFVSSITPLTKTAINRPDCRAARDNNLGLRITRKRPVTWVRLSTSIRCDACVRKVRWSKEERNFQSLRYLFIFLFAPWLDSSLPLKLLLRWCLLDFYYKHTKNGEIKGRRRARARGRKGT